MMLLPPCWVTRALPLVLGCTVASGNAGCRCEEERPFTPFRITPSPSGSALALEPSPLPSAGPAFTRRAATVAPKDVSSWSLDGVPLGVDSSRVIDRAIAADFDADGKADAVAWTRLRGGNPDSQSGGELVVFSAAGAAAGRVLAGPPPFLPGGPECRHTVSLTQTGPRTVTLDLSATCSAALVPRSATRGVSVIAPMSERPAVLSIRTADPAPGERFSVSVDSTDRDGDGRDDARLSVTLHSEGNDQEATLDLAWLDRAAGASRDPSEPGRSLGALASLENVRAPGKTTGKKVPLRVENARRLYATLCAEGGTARVFDADGTLLPCGDLAAGLTQLLSAEVRSFVAQKDARRAAAALDRDGWFGAAAPQKVRAGLEKEIVGIARERAAGERTLGVTPRARAGLPRWSPLSFEMDGSLLILTAEGVLRARLPELAPEDVSDRHDPWPLLAGGQGAPRWTGMAFSCDRGEILLLQSSDEGVPLPAVPAPLLAPRPGPCRPGGQSPTPALRPVEWTAGRTVGLVGLGLVGAPELAAPREPPKGGPFSTDGRIFVAPWARGLLVTTDGKAETWLVNEPSLLSDCVPAPGAAAVACIRQERAVVFVPAGTLPAAGAPAGK